MLIFPYLEKYGREASAKIMWDVADEIRTAIKACRRQVMEQNNSVVHDLTDLYKKISDMFFAETHLKNLSEQQSGATDTVPNDGLIHFGTGVLRLDPLSALLDKLPIDITFVDENDIVRYFSRVEERVFPWTTTVIGRHVNNCHPPQSVHIVEKLVSDFKSGVKDSEDFWIQMKGMFVLIRYFAVRDENGCFLGTLEVTQNITPI